MSQRDVVTGGIEIIGLALPLESTDGMVDGSQRGNLAHAAGGLNGAHISQAGIIALGGEQCLKQKRHTLTIAIALTHNLGRSVRLVTADAFLKGNISNVVLYPSIGILDLIQVGLAITVDVGQDFIQ